MNNYKASVDFSYYLAADLGPQAQSIHDRVEANATIFNKTPLAMPEFQTNIDDMVDKLVAKGSGAYADTLAFNIARGVVEENLGDLGAYVNTVAKGSESILLKSNFPYYSTTRTPDYSAPAAPDNVTIRRAATTGSCLLRYRPSRRPSTNEVQTCVGDPTVESNWKTVGFFTSGRAMLSGITPGTVIWARVRTVGLLNVMGAWSTAVSVMVV